MNVAQSIVDWISRKDKNMNSKKETVLFRSLPSPDPARLENWIYDNDCTRIDIDKSLFLIIFHRISTCRWQRKAFISQHRYSSELYKYYWLDLNIKSFFLNRSLILKQFASTFHDYLSTDSNCLCDCNIYRKISRLSSASNSLSSDERLTSDNAPHPNWLCLRHSHVQPYLHRPDIFFIKLSHLIALSQTLLVQNSILKRGVIRESRAGLNLRA